MVSRKIDAVAEPREKRGYPPALRRQKALAALFQIMRRTIRCADPRADSCRCTARAAAPTTRPARVPSCAYAEAQRVPARLLTAPKPEAPRAVLQLVEREAIDGEIGRVGLMGIRDAEIPHVPGKVVGSDAARGDGDLEEIGSQSAAREGLVTRKGERDREIAREEPFAVLALHAIARRQEQLAKDGIAIARGDGACSQPTDRLAVLGSLPRFELPLNVSRLGEHLARAIDVQMKDLHAAALGSPERTRQGAAELLLDSVHVKEPAHEENLARASREARQVKSHRRFAPLVFGRGGRARRSAAATRST